MVGAGPGDPGLITVRGCQCLARADVVLYDYLANPQILAHAREGAELVCLGRHGHGRLVPDSEVTARMIAAAAQGRQVVRLKGGDPAVFAHAAEETAALEAASIDYEIVPGITAFLAAGSYSGIPLTHGESASALALVTGQERADKVRSNLDFAALAAFPGTLVFYMGITTAPQWSAALIQAGKPADTPAAIVRRCSWPDQQTIVCTLGTLAEEIKARHVRPPALIVVGQVAAVSTQRNWFERRPLFGQRILVTRAAHQAPSLAATLTELGAAVHFQPAIEITDPSDWSAVDDAIVHLDRYEWLVFSSANGVRSFLDRLLLSRDLRALAPVRLAAIGPGSADELARYHLRADLVPEQFRAEALSAALAPEARNGRRFLLVRASRGREVLAAELTAAGGHVEQVVTYTSRDVPTAREEVVEQLTAGQIDWITVSSSAIARSLVQMLGPQLQGAKLASISPITSATLRDLGYPPTVEARTYTMAGLVEAICQAVERP